MVRNQQPCPCCSTKTYEQCCQPYHEGIKECENALALMRSRYSAYALCLPDYIIKTTHPENPGYTVYSVDFDLWKKEILVFSKNTAFKRLEIHSFVEGELRAFVTFTAFLFQGNKETTLTEKSEFEKIDGHWLYKNGFFE